jgi:hypothetical protein
MDSGILMIQDSILVCSPDPIEFRILQHCHHKQRKNKDDENIGKHNENNHICHPDHHIVSIIVISMTIICTIITITSHLVQ